MKNRFVFAYYLLIIFNLKVLVSSQIKLNFEYLNHKKIFVCMFM